MALSKLTRSWLHECIANHEECNYSKASSQLIEDHETSLPTRLLEVRGDPNAPSVRLIQTTEGMKGRYCALSHCWGTNQQRPLQTTLANLQAHLDGIAFDCLPKTFSDALTLACSIGIGYVWIDSLCIIQDDRNDWDRESQTMGALYEKAVLVIAAAGSNNCTEGLFISNRPAPVTLKVPYVISDGSTHGSFNVALSAEGELRPGNGPLRLRAWAAQEWYLSRRMGFFMPGGLTWRCRRESVDELGNHRDLVIYDHDSWSSFLDDYSSKALTVVSDRLPAIQGIVNEMQKTKDSRFLYGIWEDQLIEQLLWRAYPKSGDRDRLVDLPSWCWASTGTEKLWLPHTRNEELLSIPQTVKIGDTGCLTVPGTLIRPIYGENEISTCCTTKMFEQIRIRQEMLLGLGNIEVTMLPGYSDDKHPSFLVFDQHHPRSIIGYAVFDEKEVITNALCFLLGTTTRKTTDPMSFHFKAEAPKSETSQTTRSHSEDMSLPEADDMDLEAIGDPSNVPTIHSQPQTPEEQISSDIPMSDEELDAFDSDESEDREPYLSECTSDCIDLFQAAPSDHVYWALLLEQIGSEARFRRVGAAMLYPRVMDVKKEDLTEFEII
ncbi:HET-domain-containing protein [Melanomma pulvis-pyrius CBS 109.77]|uniref:HET-domain-containing protein n=1 Tax=Melanomma pulvis-pyrius CBS 109.77 TaxID=1314802 RepID=A0A6A6WXP5_9PLEO|nr:HET-domain-containing protein [Melanomma pulvis-pyrius CBS 109.77]